MARQMPKRSKPGVVNALEQINPNAAGIDIVFDKLKTDHLAKKITLKNRPPSVYFQHHKRCWRTGDEEGGRLREN